MASSAKDCKYFCATKKFQYFASVSATVGAFGLGTVLAWSSPAIPNMTISGPNHEYKINLTNNDKAWIASIATLGALASGPLAAYLMTKLGRKTAMLLITSPFVLGWLLITYSKTYIMMLIGRFMTGFCGGAMSLLAPIFIGENVQSCIRGRLASGFQVMIVSGILFAYVFGAFLNWQWLALTCGFVPLVFTVFMIFMPESPRYFLTVGQPEDAVQALAWLRGADSPDQVEEELKAIQKSIDENSRSKVTLRELFQNPHIFKPTFVTTCILVFQQLSGINSVIFFTDEIVNQANIEMNADDIRIIIGSIQLIVAIISAFLVDRVGRRILLMISAMIMTVSHIILGVYFQLEYIEFESIESIRWIPAVTIVILVSGYSVGFGGIPWVLTSELLNRRGIEWTAPIPTSCHWASAFLVTMFFELIRKATDLQWIYFGHGVVCFAATIYVYFMLPETKGKTLDEISLMFGKFKKMQS